MQVLVNTDNHIEAGEGFISNVQSEVETALALYADRITRVEVYLNDVNGQKSGDHDKRCLLEARIGGKQPLAVEHRAESLELALSGATEKMERLIDNTLGKLNDHKGRTSFSGDEATQL